MSVRKSLLESSTHIPSEIICLFQQDTNRCLFIDAISNNWLGAILRNSVDQDLRKAVDKYYEDIPNLEKGGVVYLKLLLDRFNNNDRKLLSLDN